MMPDPLDALRLPVVPVEPRPEFADALLRRITATGTGSLPRPRRRPSATSSTTSTPRSRSTALQLGFEEELRSAPAFAMLYRGNLRLLLSVPGLAGAGRALPDGTVPAPGRWNRIALQVADLAAAVAALRAAGARFRAGMAAGVGVRQVLAGRPVRQPRRAVRARPRTP